MNLSFEQPIYLHDKLNKKTDELFDILQLLYDFIRY